MMEVLAETPAYPVSYDDDRHAFFLCNDIAFDHCMSCGGSLPKLDTQSQLSLTPMKNTKHAQSLNLRIRSKNWQA